MQKPKPRLGRARFPTLGAGCMCFASSSRWFIALFTFVSYTLSSAIVHVITFLILVLRHSIDNRSTRRLIIRQGMIPVEALDQKIRLIQYNKPCQCSSFFVPNPDSRSN